MEKNALREVIHTKRRESARMKYKMRHTIGQIEEG